VHHGVDKKGQPIALVAAGRTDPTLLTKFLTEDQLKEYFVYYMEHKKLMLADLTKEKGVVMRANRIIDLTGLGRKHLAPKALRNLRNVLSLVQDHYPETAGNLIYVNVPWLFSTIWATIKPWIQPATLEKIIVTGRNYQETLLKLVDAKYLPKFLGGECVCAERGGCVYEPDPDEGMKKVVVGRGGVQETTIEVPPATDKDVKDPFTIPYLVTWEFRTESNNIDFEVIFKPKSGGTPEEVFKKERVDSHLKIIEGGFEAKNAGTVIFTWDNKFSWTSSKTVFYFIEVGSKEVKEDEPLSPTGSTSTESTTTTTTTTTTTAS